MLKTRIIPCLDVIKNKVVKGVNFKNIRVMGNAVEMAKYYSLSGADELCMLDINASYQNRKTFIKTVESIAKVINIPLTVGGGVSDLSDITDLLNAGADKVSINSAAVKNPKLIRQASLRHGSQCIVVAIDGKRHKNKMKVVIKGGREITNNDLITWAKQVQSLGAGEILMTSMDTDGVQNGFDSNMLKKVTSHVSIPVIGAGGINGPEYLENVKKAIPILEGIIAGRALFTGALRIDDALQMYFEHLGEGSHRLIFPLKITQNMLTLGQIDFDSIKNDDPSGEQAANPIWNVSQLTDRIISIVGVYPFANTTSVQNFMDLSLIHISEPTRLLSIA